MKMLLIKVKITLDQLEKDGFEDHPYYYLLVAEHENQIIGVCFTLLDIQHGKEGIVPRRFCC